MGQLTRGQGLGVLTRRHCGIDFARCAALRPVASGVVAMCLSPAPWSSCPGVSRQRLPYTGGNDAGDPGAHSAARPDTHSVDMLGTKASDSSLGLSICRIRARRDPRNLRYFDRPSVPSDPTSWLTLTSWILFAKPVKIFRKIGMKSTQYAIFASPLQAPIIPAVLRIREAAISSAAWSHAMRWRGHRVRLETEQPTCGDHVP
jgi:hypothetical protein